MYYGVDLFLAFEYNFIPKTIEVHKGANAVIIWKYNTLPELKLLSIIEFVLIANKKSDAAKNKKRIFLLKFIIIYSY